MSLINSKVLKLKLKKDNDNGKVNLRTINGVNKTEQLIKIKAKIFEIEKDINVFIIDNENFKFDFLIGLDMIKKFGLTQDENLNIAQKMEKVTTVHKYEKGETEIPDGADKTNRQKLSMEKQEVFYEINFNENLDTTNFISITDHLDIEKKNKIDELINKYKHTFAKDKYDIGTIKEYEARIDLTIDKYCSKRPYRCTIQDKKEIEQQISELLKRNLIEESVLLQPQ